MAESITVSPIRMGGEIRRALGRAYHQELKEHGLSHAVCVALAAHLGLKPPATPAERMSKASKTRWRRARVEKKKPARKSKAKGGATNGR